MIWYLDVDSFCLLQQVYTTFLLFYPSDDLELWPLHMAFLEVTGSALSHAHCYGISLIFDINVIANVCNYCRDRPEHYNCMLGSCLCIAYVKTRYLQCVVLPLIKITKCTDGKHRNYDFTIIILWNNHYNLNFNVGDSKK